MMEYKKVIRNERHGDYSIGVGIELSIDREVTAEERSKLSTIVDDIQDMLLKGTVLKDPKALDIGELETMGLLDCFPDKKLQYEKLPNGYCSQGCCVTKPWLRVMTHKGPITIGWRKRVISIDWNFTTGTDRAEELFPNEDVTKGERDIHAWGYDKAREYLEKILR